MGEKPIVSLRVYRGKEVNFDENGKIRNENQSIKVFYNTVEWTNQLKHLRANGYIKVDVESAKVIKSGKVVSDYQDIESIKLEVKKAFEGNKEVVMTPEQKKIADLEAKLEAFMYGSKPENNETKNSEEENKKDVMKELRAKYRDLNDNKGGSPRWSEEDYRQKIAELENNQ